MKQDKGRDIVITDDLTVSKALKDETYDQWWNVMRCRSIARHINHAIPETLAGETPKNDPDYGDFALMNEMLLGCLEDVVLFLDALGCRMTVGEGNEEKTKFV